MRTRQESRYPQAGKRALSPETNPTGTLTLDFQSSELGENTLLFFKLSHLGCLIPVAQAAPREEMGGNFAPRLSHIRKC